MHVTWFDSNTWLFEIAGQKILVDPWLKGPLVFGGAGWLFRGEHPADRPLPDDVDFIVLSQGLEDHAHPETLKAFDHGIPVVGSPNAAKVVTDLGFTELSSLEHGQIFTGAGWTLKAVPGAPIGPMLVENGYILTEQSTGLKLFYEPHGFHESDLKSEGPVDVVISPMVDLSLPLLGPIIRGQRSAFELAEWLQPQVMLPTAEAGEAQYKGLLLSLLQVTGSVDEVRAKFAESGKSIQVRSPRVGERIEIACSPRADRVDVTDTPANRGS